MDFLNGGPLSNQPAFPGQCYNGGANKIIREQVDPSTFDDDSDDEDCEQIKGLKPGKKTKGRVKIKMEFIENKLRRYTTFSKRKTGIMKKAYELSTLTGTQVMLLVASETGHVYTFATRKLQPMITSESGKALIQTCLNSPDPPPIAPGQQQAVEQRMNPGGFEETELTYSVEEENGKTVMVADGGCLKTVYALTNSSESETQSYIQQQQTQLVQTAHTQQGQGQTFQQISAAGLATIVQQSTSPQSTKTATSGNISLQIPGLPQGFILQPTTSFTMPIHSSTPQTTQVTTSLPQHQTVYRLSTSNQQLMSTNQQQTITPSVFMYQTPQGIVYAPATGTLGDKTIFNFQPSSQTNANGQQQQLITIPIPVSLSSSNQLIQLSSADTQHIQELSPPVNKKSRKA